MQLTAEQEEVATAFARYMDTPHAQKKTFIDNFFKEFLRLLNPPGSITPHIISDFNKCDFSPIAKFVGSHLSVVASSFAKQRSYSLWNPPCRHLQAQREEQKNRTREQKIEEREQKAKSMEKYLTAVVDGAKSQVANYMVEPPGLFLGRGEHPKAGTWKRRIMPSDITLNLGEADPVPASPIPGSTWRAIVHEHDALWIAKWSDNVTGMEKYVFLAPTAQVRMQDVRRKFEAARSVKVCSIFASDVLVSVLIINIYISVTCLRLLLISSASSMRRRCSIHRVRSWSGSSVRHFGSSTVLASGLAMKKTNMIL